MRASHPRMGSCRNLEELYLTGYQCCDTQRPDISTVWPTTQSLRILVLDVLQDIKTLVCHMLSPRCSPPKGQHILLHRPLPPNLTASCMCCTSWDGCWGTTRMARW